MKPKSVEEITNAILNKILIINDAYRYIETLKNCKLIRPPEHIKSYKIGNGYGFSFRNKIFKKFTLIFLKNDYKIKLIIKGLDLGTWSSETILIKDLEEFKTIINNKLK